MMKSCSDLMRMIKSAEGMTRMVQLYGSREGEVARQMERYMLLLKRHEDLFGTEKMPLLVSAPGRTELCGNHTDHNNGRVLAAAVNLDTVAAVSPRDDLQITLHSEGFAPIRVDLNNLSPVKEEQGTPASIIRGIAARMQEMGCMVRGFDGTATSNVLSGSGLSSSAAFEVVNMFSTLCPDRESTQALGARLAPTLRAGDVILLSGDMGAGKSEFARGVARGLGIACAVPSPSFTILNVYEEGRVPLYHFDWYRIGDESELTDMGLDEFIGGNGVTLIEWHERASDLLPETALEVRLRPPGKRRA